MRLPAVLALVLMSQSLLAQAGSPSDTINTPNPDSLVVLQPLLPFTPADSLSDLNVKGFQSSKSPGIAMLLSALVPGAGQAYNESYWKVPIVAGFGAYFISQWFRNDKRYLEYRDQYRESFATIPSGDGRLLQLREFYKDQRDSFTWYLAILYVLNVADAYVDASLYDFNVGEGTSMNLLPAPRSLLTIRIGF